MQNLINYSSARINSVSTKFVRYLTKEIEWDDRLIGITGARGTGKTTLMLQHIKNTFGASGDTLYVSLDDYYFTQHRLFDLAEKFYMNGGLHLFVDEVHKYPSWSIDIKNIYDIFPELKIVFSGSSALQLHKATGDLSRRAAMYHLHELSFREYLNLTLKTNFESILISDILSNHQKLAGDIVKNIRITALFKNYLQNGAYPFFIEAKGQYYDRLINTVNTIIENDLPAIENINYQSVHKLRKLISLIADSVPFKINISELSRKSGLSRDVLLRLLALLDNASLITNIRQKGAPTGHLTKPDKIYLNNTALLFAINTNQQVSSGTIRETFFMNQLIQKHKLLSVKKGDFLVDNKYTFEIGGRNKTNEQIAGLNNAFVVADDIEFGYKNTIPLWMFGFLY
ncbi:MAG: AAA family ATPase [Bacteroidales bacterium]|nr:AAA family ATPase [Bacteroidales bacterium]MCF8402594.1 AAA family ATPase [Bacteroidales bacterium]